MLICSCNIIAKSEIEVVVREFLAQDPWQLITPMKVYYELEKRGRCCGCFPNVINIIVSETEMFHRDASTPDAIILPFIAKIKEEHQRCETSRRLMRVQTRSAKQVSQKQQSWKMRLPVEPPAIKT